MALVPRIMTDKMFLDDVFDNFMFPRVKNGDFYKMNCDIYEQDNVYYLEIDIPGFDKSDINIEIDDNDYLTITAEKSNSNTQGSNGKTYIHKERSYGRYHRTFYLGGIDKSGIDANFNNGTLTIIMPKKQETNLIKQTIEIK